MVVEPASLPAVAPFDQGLAFFQSHGDELVLKQWIGKGVIGSDVERPGLFPFQRGQKDQLSALHKVDGFKTAHQCVGIVRFEG